MRALALLLAFAGFLLPAFGAKRITVTELEQTIASSHSLPDAEVAKKLSDLELTERLSGARLDRLKGNLPGEKTRQALLILADSSVFLRPPADEASNQPAPDVATQRKILALTVNYISRTIHQLPNLFATRATTNFEDAPITSQGSIRATAYQPIHQVSQTRDTVSFRDGREVVEKSKLDARMRTLTTSGVFGQILGTVLVDSARSKLAWSHWEKGASGRLAVFSYAVPKEKSHYTISYDSLPTERESTNPCSPVPQTYSEVVGYHGEMAVDPESGTIKRLMLIADVKSDEFTEKSGIEVEYGQVILGGKPYFLPVRSVSSSRSHFLRVANGDCQRLEIALGLKNSLNDVVFENYHVFRSDVTVLTESEAAKLEGQPVPAPNEAGSAHVDGEAASTARDGSAESQPPESRPPDSRSSDSRSAGSPQNAEAASEGALSPSKTSNGADFSAPGKNSGLAPSPEPPATSVNPEDLAAQEALLREMPVYRANAQDVVVDVVVTKGNGDPVRGLTKQDFTVTEDGKRQAIDFLEEHSADDSVRAEPQALPRSAPGTYTNAPLAPVGDSINVLLLDTLNTPQQDQAYVHHEISEFLKKMQPGTRIAIFALGSKLRYVQGFTTDSAVLLAALNDKQKGAASVKQSRDRGDAADEAADLERLTMMQSMGVGYLRDALADQSSFDLGTRVSMTLEALDHLALYLAGIPGRKNLIWFSSSFPVVIFPSVAQRERIENAPNMRGYLKQVKKTANMFTVSQISIYPVGAQGMMVEHAGEADSAASGATEVNGHFGNVADGPKSNGTMTPLIGGAADRANTMAAMQQLASSTGGKAYVNTNDLNGALTRAIKDGAHYYTLSYSPTNGKMDGTYRDIEINLTRGHYTLAYRRGYNADTSSSLEATAGTDPLAPVMKLGMPSTTGLFYGVRVAPMTKQPQPNTDRAGQNSNLSGAMVRYKVDFFVRLADVAFEPGPKGEHNGRIEVGLMAYDHDGNAVNWERVTQAMNLQPAAYDSMQKSGIPVHMEIDLPEENTELVTGVYDWGNGKTGSLEIPLSGRPANAKPAH